MKLNLKLLGCCSLAATILGNINLNAQSAQTSWVGRMGGASSDIPTYNSVATDGSGNVYLAGPYSAGVSNGPATFSSHNTATFAAGGFNTMSLPFTHSNNQFVYKADQAGNVQWVKQIAGDATGGFNTVIINAIDADATGNIYITGKYRAGVDLDPGTAVVTPTLGSSTGDNMFILKLNTSGNYVWHREFRDVAGGTGDAQGDAIKVDASGNIYAALRFRGTVGLYAPGSTTASGSISSTGTVGGNNSTAIIKLDASGNLTWSKRFSVVASSSSRPYDIDVDASGNVYTVGQFSGLTGNEIDFDPAHNTPSGASMYTSSAHATIPTFATQDIFISKLSSSGNYVWAKVLGGGGDDYAYSLAINSSSLYIAGSIASPSIDMNPGGTASSLTNMGNSDAFVAAYALDGTYQWANKYGGGALDQANGITCLPNGDLYIAGRVSTSGVPLDFDPQTTGNQGLTVFPTASTNNNTEAYILKLGNNGSFKWVYTAGVAGAGNTNDYAFGIASYENAGVRSIYTSGSTGSLGASALDANQAQFPVNLNDLSTTPVIRIAGTGTGGSSGGGGDIFLHKGTETVCTPTTSTVTTSSCGSYTLGSNTYTQSGSYTATLTNNAGCDSIVTLNLTINPTSTSNFTQTACDSFEFGGQMYYQSGNYTHVFTNAAGCDSSVTVFLAIGESSTATLTETACGSYTLGTETYTQTGAYTQTISNALGCDSVITLNLTITNPNVTVTQADNVLTAQTTGASYQWINCSNNEPIAGATQQTYTATANGSYAVIVTENNCSDTSNCFTVNTVSIKGQGKEKSTISVYPNPTEMQVNIESSINGSITISSIDGRIMKTQQIKTGVSTINVANFAQGVYFIKVYDLNGILKEVVKFSKK